MGINVFTYTGNTCVMTAATSAPTPIQVSSVTLGGNQYRISNQSTTVGCYRHPNFPFVPTVSEFCSSNQDCELLRTFENTMTLIRAFVAPPKTNKEHLSVLRNSLAAIMVDPDYLSEAKKIGIEVSPVS